VQHEGPRMGPKQIDDYFVDRHLRGGAYGELWRGRAISSGEAVNVRVVHRWAHDEVERLHREVQILRRLSDDNVVQLRNLKKTATRFYMVFEACTGGDLAQLLRVRGRLPEATAWQFLSQIAAGLEALHCQVGVHHGDLRPGNILLARSCSTPSSSSTSTPSSRSACSASRTASASALPGLPRLKLANLGAPAAGSHSRCPAVTPYTAPEVLCGAPPSKQADLWAAGVVFHELLTGTTPFPAMCSDKARLLKIMTRAPELQWLSATVPFVGDAGRRLLLVLLDPRPERRPVPGEVLDATVAHCSIAALLEASQCALAGPLTIGEEEPLVAWPLEAQASWKFATMSCSRSSATTELATILEVDGEMDERFQLRDEAVSSPSSASPAPAALALVVPAGGGATTTAPVVVPAVAQCSAEEVEPVLCPPVFVASAATASPQLRLPPSAAAATAAWLFVGGLPRRPSELPLMRKLFGDMAASLGPAPLFGRFLRFVARASEHGDEGRNAAGSYRVGLPLGSDSGSAPSPVISEVKSFCVSELKKSHFFRLRLARLSPRVLYAI